MPWRARLPGGKSGFLIGARMLNWPLAAMSNQARKPAPEANFEQAMKRLEAIVEQMESGELSLEDLIVRYEEGMKLVKVCQERLVSAEQRIEIITRNSARCLECNDEIESTSRHDLVTCGCGNVFVDGGHQYRRRGFRTDAWEDTSEYTIGTLEVPE